MGWGQEKPVADNRTEEGGAVSHTRPLSFCEPDLGIVCGRSRQEFAFHSPEVPVEKRQSIGHDDVMGPLRVKLRWISWKEEKEVREMTVLRVRNG